MVAAFFSRGWCSFPSDPALGDWLGSAEEACERALVDPQNDAQFQCERTWFLGLDALPNDARGRVGNGPALDGDAVRFASGLCGGLPALHRGQLSVIWPGYPKPREGESEAAFRYRLKRDAAHVDGVHGIGTPKRRFLHEYHGFILGMPLNNAGPDAAPLVVWEGSHEIMRTALREALQGHDPERWHQLDVTQVYKSARQACFEQCRRVSVHVPKGGAYVVHRLALHGMAPWPENVSAGAPDRRIVYFRPELAQGRRAWLELP